MLMSSLMGKFCNKQNPYVQLFLFLFSYLILMLFYSHVEENNP
jgi:hypothetical protein